MVLARLSVSILALTSLAAHVAAAPSALARPAEPELDARGFQPFHDWLTTQPWWQHFTRTVTATGSSSPTATPTPSTPGTVQSPVPTDSFGQKAYLDPHNAARRQHGAQDLVWSDTLAAAAQRWASGCKFAHSNGTVGNYGENLAAGTGNFTTSAAIKLWTDEAAQYNPNEPVASHFTQVVWKSSTELGCAHALCDGIFDPPFGKAHYYVCEYSPPGNVVGQYGNNVQA